MEHISKAIPKAMPERPTSPEWLPKPLRNATVEIVERYGDSEKFLKTFNPSIQIRVAANVERVYMGKAPKLSAVCKAYSHKVAETWLMAQLENLNDFCGVKHKMSIPQMRELSEMLIIEAYYLKVSELMLFFHRFKAGRYGEFFGVVDPQRIMSGLCSFLRDRVEEMARFERMSAQKNIDEELKQGGRYITYDEYINLKTKEKSEHEDIHKR